MNFLLWFFGCVVYVPTICKISNKSSIEWYTFLLLSGLCNSNFFFFFFCWTTHDRILIFCLLEELRNCFVYMIWIALMPLLENWTNLLVLSELLLGCTAIRQYWALVLIWVVSGGLTSCIHIIFGAMDHVAISVCLGILNLITWLLWLSFLVVSSHTALRTSHNTVLLSLVGKCCYHLWLANL